MIIPPFLHKFSWHLEAPLPLSRNSALLGRSQRKLTHEIPWSSPTHLYLSSAHIFPTTLREHTGLHSCSKMRHLVCHTFLCQLGELGIGELRSYDVEQRKGLSSVKPKRSIEWLPWLRYSVTRNVNERTDYSAGVLAR